MAPISLILSIALALFVGDTGAVCRDGWTRHGASCYHFSHDKEEWGSAKKICEYFGGTLAVIDDVTEGRFISGQAAVLGHDLWVAANNLMVEGEWLWSPSNKALNASIFSNWLPGQPNNSNGAQNCLQVQDSGLWNDKECSDTANYVCESLAEQPIIIG